MLHLNFSGTATSGKTTTARTLFDNLLGERKEWVSGGCTSAYLRNALRTCDVVVLDGADYGPTGNEVPNFIFVVSEVQVLGKLRCKLLITTSELPIVLSDAEIPPDRSRSYMVMAQTLNNPKVMRE